MHAPLRRRVSNRDGGAAKRIKLVLAAIMLAAVCGIATICALSGFTDAVLSLSLPPYMLLLKTGYAESVPVMAISTDPALSVSGVERIYPSAKAKVTKGPADPQILIYHTHTTEAYLQSDGYSYVESGRWRTKDAGMSVVAVGALLAKTLQESYGIRVIHDTTDHEPPKLSTAYSRSLSTMLSYKAKYPSLEIFIDLHRDAYGSADIGNTEPKDFIVLNGEELARIMFVVGTGKGATGSGFDGLPDFDANYAFAETITEALLKTDAGIVREVRIKSGRYNQHISSHCLLVEVGHNANTLPQALASIPYLAAAIDSAMRMETIETASLSQSEIWTPSETPG